MNILDFSVISSLGSDRQQAAKCLRDRKIPPITREVHGELDLPLMRAPFDENKWDFPNLLHYNSRNNRLLWQAFEQLKLKRGSLNSKRVGLCLATSTSGILEAEGAYRSLAESGEWSPNYNYRQHELNSGVDFLTEVTGIEGPRLTVSTACSSSAKVFAVAKRWLTLDWCDVVIVGGCDTLCDMTLLGFSSLAAYAPVRCNPFSLNRNGIHIGEAAALFVLGMDESPIALAGTGESSDAHHISAPDPEGKGAFQAMSLALKESGLKNDDIGYINAHGTGTPLNDSMEAKAMAKLFPSSPPISSTKGLTGHCLGAAGALEAAITTMVLLGETGGLPPHLYDGVLDPNLASLSFVTNSTSEQAPPRSALTNSFAFGGSNCSLVLKRS
jgi:3-oxoacyl-[acyl-carrier-protein] synthase I